MNYIRAGGGYKHLFLEVVRVADEDVWRVRFLNNGDLPAPTPERPFEGAPLSVRSFTSTELASWSDLVIAELIWPPAKTQPQLRDNIIEAVAKWRGIVRTIIRTEEAAAWCHERAHNPILWTPDKAVGF